MDRDAAIKAIIRLETTAGYCEKYSRRRRRYLMDAYQLRMQQEPPETRKLSQLESIIRARRNNG